MGRVIGILAVVVLGLGALVVSQSVYMVSEIQQALVVRLGEPRKPVNVNGDEAGLHFKTPFLEQVLYFDKRNLEFDSEVKEITASDQERLLVDAFVRWRISDPLTFQQSLQDEAFARSRLDGLLDDALRGVLGAVESQEIISGRRAELMQNIQTIVNNGALADGLGIEVIDVKIKRADLPNANAERVFSRMQTERQQVAAGIRAEGEEQGLEIRANADREARVLRAQATQEAEQIRGEGDRQRNAIYADAYELDPEFFAFYRSMIAYERAIESDTTLVLSPDSDFFRYFEDLSGQ